jgi:hypothetical protein
LSTPAWEFLAFTAADLVLSNEVLAQYTCTNLDVEHQADGRELSAKPSTPAKILAPC